MHCGDAEALAIIDKQVTEFCLTEATRVSQNSLKDGLKVAWRAGDRAEYLGGRRLLLQRLEKVPPHLGELTGARFELLFQLAQRIGPVANARFRLRSGRTKLATVRPALPESGWHGPDADSRPAVRPYLTVSTAGATVSWGKIYSSAGSEADEVTKL